jgi:hypothetical protein
MAEWPFDGTCSHAETERELRDAVICVEERLCSTGMPLPCGHDRIYEQILVRGLVEGS